MEELLGECITEYGFSKDDCLDILQEFENRYGGYDEVIKQFRSKYYNYDAEEFEAPQATINPQWAMNIIQSQYDNVGIDRVLSVREDFEGDLDITILLTNGNKQQFLIEKSMIGLIYDEDNDEYVRMEEEFGADVRATYFHDGWSGGYEYQCRACDKIHSNSDVALACCPDESVLRKGGVFVEAEEFGAEDSCRKCGRDMGESTVHHDVARCPYNDPTCYTCENCSNHDMCDDPDNPPCFFCGQESCENISKTDRDECENPDLDEGEHFWAETFEAENFTEKYIQVNNEWPKRVELFGEGVLFYVGEMATIRYGHDGIVRTELGSKDRITSIIDPMGIKVEDVEKILNREWDGSYVLFEEGGTVIGGWRQYEAQEFESEFTHQDMLALRKHIDMPPESYSKNEGFQEKRWRRYNQKQKGMIPMAKSPDAMRREVVKNLPKEFKIAQYSVVALFAGLISYSIWKENKEE